jgi:hypothetical protein
MNARTVRTRHSPTFKFPINNEEQKYEARITFTAREVQSFDVDFLFDIANVSTTNILDLDKVRFDGTTEAEFAAGAGGGVEAQAAAQAAAVEAANKGGPGSQSMINATGQKFKGGPKGKVSLYLPQAVQINDGASYANVDLGIMGAGGAAAMAEGANLLPALIDGAGQSAASIIDAIMGRAPNSPELARLAVNRAAKFLPGEGMRGAVASATRVSVNPNTRALFKSVPLREFTFTFKMIPTSKKETEQIKGIIKFFRTNLYPEVIDMGGIPAGFKFPHVFEISLKYAKNKELATKILPSYIRSFAATYNASGMGFLEGGDFSEVDITMSFIESGTLHKQLVKDGY